MGGRSAHVGAGGQCPKPDPAVAWGAERGFAWGRGYRCKCPQAWGSGDSRRGWGRGMAHRMSPSPAWKPRGNPGPALPDPPAARATPGKWRPLSTPGLLAASGQGLSRPVPVAPAPPPLPCREPSSAPRGERSRRPSQQRQLGGRCPRT